MRWLQLLVCVPLSCANLPDATAEWNGNRLHEYCSKPMGHVGRSYCIGYVQGVIDHDFELERVRYFGYVLTHRLYEANRLRNKPGPYSRRFCMPKSASLDEAVAVFRTWLRAHPERLHSPANILAVDAFKGAWPCS